MGVENLVLACSYNKEYAEAGIHKRIHDEAEQELRKGRHYNHHYLYYIGDEVKFLWQLHGVPIAGHMLINAMRSQARNIAVVGNALVGALVDAFCEEYRAELAGRTVRFVHEGNRLSLSNTLLKGMDGLRLKEGEAYGLLCGDIPLDTDVDGLLSNPAIMGHDWVLGLNCFESIFKGEHWPGHFPRYYHFRVGGFHVKENNRYLLRNSRALTDQVEDIYAARKTTRSGGLKPFLFKRVLRNMHRLLPYLVAHEPRNLMRLGAEELRCVNASFSFGYKPFDATVADFDVGTVSRLFSVCAGFPVVASVGEDNPGTLEDIDSAEDFGIVAEMMRREPRVYMHQEDSERVRRNVMPRLAQTHPLFGDFPRYANTWCERVGMPALFRAGCHIEDFCSTFPKFTESMVHAGIDCHMQFNKRLNGSQARARQVP